MFLKHYGMREQPFGVTPNPRYLYLSPTHREALASLVYGIEAGRGFMALIAPPGMGKTTLLFQVLGRLHSSARTAFLFHTQCNWREFFHYLLSDLGIDSQGSDLAHMHDQLNQVLLAEARAGRRFVLVVDEAQNLDDSVLETVRLLSDFETPRAKLMQIILAGQPQFAEKLGRPGLAQLRQRISILARLDPFNSEDTRRYISHRLRVAGYEGPALFTPEAIEIIGARGGGVPRNINNICFNALSLGFALGKKKIDSAMVLEALGDLDVGALGEGADDARQPSLPQTAVDRSAAQPPARSHDRTVAPQPARLTRKVAEARERSRWLANTGGPAVRVGALAAGVLAAACFLVLFLERAKLDERLPLPQKVDASNAAHAAPGARGGVKTEAPAGVRSQPLPREPAGQANPSSPGARANAITSRSVRHGSRRDSIVTSGSPPLRATLHANQRPTGSQMPRKPLEIWTALPRVPVVQAELVPSLRARDNSALGATGSAPVTLVRVSSSAQAAKLVFRPPPEYPEAAKSAHVQGTVRLEAVLAKDGTVASLRVLSGHPLLVESAEKAVARWRYEPTLAGGNPVEVVTEVDVDFAF
jgi:general secretion pathway protein A